MHPSPSSDTELSQLTEILLDAFQRSSAVEQGGPGGFPIIVGDRVWHVGYSPSRVYWAGDGYGSRATAKCTHHFTLTRHTALLDSGGSQAKAAPVTSPAVVAWLTRLVLAANKVEWGQPVEIEPLP